MDRFNCLNQSISRDIYTIYILICSTNTNAIDNRDMVILIIKFYYLHYILQCYYIFI